MGQRFLNPKQKKAKANKMTPLGTPMRRTNIGNMQRMKKKPAIGSDLQRAYISAAHKPNQRIGIKPVNPAKPMFAKKVR